MNGFPEQILLATDGLVSMVAAARAAAVHLTEKGGAELHLVHVWHTVPSPHFDRVIRSGFEEIGRDRLEQQVRLIEDAGGTVVEANLREGRAVEEIIALADEIGAGLVIVGSRGMGWLGRLALGSASTGIAHRSLCPVLIVREWSQFALIVCAMTVVLTMVYTRETARRVDNDPGYLITTASRRSRSSRRGHVLQARTLPVVWNKGCTGDGSGPALVRAFRGGHLLLRLLHDPDHCGRFRALHLLDKQGRIVRGIAVARTEKASMLVEVACDPCKRQRRERRHY